LVVHPAHMHTHILDTPLPRSLPLPPPDVRQQKNPHVLRSAVCCVRVVGGFAAGRASCGVAWRTLLVETVHLLRYARALL
jgi:hypothetical protein